MSGRGRGRHYSGRFGRGRGHGRGPKSSKSSQPDGTAKKKGLSNHVYYIGSAKQASDFTVITEFFNTKLRRERNKRKEEGDSIEESELNFSQLEGVCYCCGKTEGSRPITPWNSLSNLLTTLSQKTLSLPRDNH
jgi:hypothetical protein